MLWSHFTLIRYLHHNDIYGFTELCMLSASIGIARFSSPHAIHRNTHRKRIIYWKMVMLSCIVWMVIVLMVVYEVRNAIKWHSSAFSSKLHPNHFTILLSFSTWWMASTRKRKTKPFPFSLVYSHIDIYTKSSCTTQMLFNKSYQTKHIEIHP